MGMKKLAALVMAIALCLTAVGAMAANTLQVPNEYATVKAALAVVKDGQTIQLMQDIEGDGIDFKSNNATTYTFDLNNHTYTVTGNLVGSKGSKTQAFRFYDKADSITVKNGRLTATAGSNALWLINSYGNVTYENVVVDASKLTSSQTQALHTNNGTNQLLGTSSVIAPAGYPAIVVNDSTSSSYPGAATMTINTKGDIQGNVTVTGGEKAGLTITNVSNKSQMDIVVESGDANMSNLPVGTEIENKGTGAVTANGVVLAKGERIVIPAPVYDDLPQTGDNSSLMLWASMLALAAAGFAASRKTRLN